MRRSGTVWPWLLLLFGSACGDHVVVARGVSLVSAAEFSDAGLIDAGADPESHFGSGGSGSTDHHPATTSPNHAQPEPHGTGGGSLSSPGSSEGAGGGGGSGSSSSTKHH